MTQLLHIRPPGGACSVLLRVMGHRPGSWRGGGFRRDIGGGYLPNPYRGA